MTFKEHRKSQKKKVIRTKKAPLPIGSYSQAVFSGNFLFLSGQIPLDSKTNQRIQGDIKEQTHQVMKNIGFILNEAGLNYTDVIKSTIFLKNLKNFNSMNEVYSKYFKEQNQSSKNAKKRDPVLFFPARSCVEVSNLPKGVDIEIEVIAQMRKKEKKKK